MEKIVGGPILAVYPWDDKVALVGNQEAKRKRLPYNRAIEDFGIVCGPFFICGSNGENLTSLTDEQAQKFNDKYHFPQKSFYDPLLDINFYTDYDPTKKQKAAKEKHQRKDQEHEK